MDGGENRIHMVPYKEGNFTTDIRKSLNVGNGTLSERWGVMWRVKVNFGREM